MILDKQVADRVQIIRQLKYTLTHLINRVKNLMKFWYGENAYLYLFLCNNVGHLYIVIYSPSLCARESCRPAWPMLPSLLLSSFEFN